MNPKMTKKCFYEKQSFREKNNFASMADDQFVAAKLLLKCFRQKHGIPLSFKIDGAAFAPDQMVLNNRREVIHSNVCMNRYGCFLGFSLKSVISRC